MTAKSEQKITRAQNLKTSKKMTAESERIFSQILMIPLFSVFYFVILSEI